MKLPDLFGQFKKNLETKWDKLYRIAYAWSHDAQLSKDLVQDTMIKALRKRHQLKDHTALDAWLCSILANNWRDFCRKREFTVDIDEFDIIDETNLEQDHDRMEIINLVRSAVAKLSIEQRQIVTLVDLEGFSYNEVAEILVIPIGTVMSRLCRARYKLKGFLLEHGNTNNNGSSKPQLWRVK